MAVNKKASDFCELKFGEFWTRKIRTFFRKLDKNGNGYVVLDDLLDVATNVIATFPNLSETAGDEIVKTAVNTWFSVICTHVPEVNKTSVQVLENDFLQNFKKVANGELKTKFQEIFVTPYFQAADGDKDGLISLVEYKNLMKCWRAVDKDSELIFRVVDDKRVGKISQDQYHYAWADYFYSEDPKSKIKLFGALVNYKRPEDYGTLDCGPYWEGKMRTMFRRLDVTENGKLTCNDFIEIARGVSIRGHLDKKKADAVMRTMLNIWVKYVAVDKEGKHLAEITEKEFIHNLRAMVNQNFRHEIDQFGWTFFKAVETDGVGYLTLQEYRNLQEAWHVGREEADVMFKVIDLDKDGKISHDEYLNAWIDYFLGEDPHSPYNCFFGPIRH